MKGSLNKILNNKNVKVLIPLIVLLVLAIVLIVYFREYKINNYRNRTDKEFYQYFAGMKFEYEATISLNKKEEIKGFVPKNMTVNYESIPIYFKDEKKVIFPSEMNIVFPLKNVLQYKVNEFSYVERVNNINYLTFEDYHDNIDHYIMYDGDNLYFFSDSVSFIKDNETITLSPMSYVMANSKKFSYYDYETDTFNSFETNNNIILSNEYYTININEDYIQNKEEKIILINDLNLLENLK